jgi:hypothetical protein
VAGYIAVVLRPLGKAVVSVNTVVVKEDPVNDVPLCDRSTSEQVRAVVGLVRVRPCIDEYPDFHSITSFRQAIAW